MTQPAQNPLRIAVYGATGMVGSRISAEALRRGHRVTAISRTGTAVPDGATPRTGDLGDGTDVAAVAADHDVVVSATGPSRTGASHAVWLAAVDTLIANAGQTRVLFVGGAGSLLLPDGTRLMDAPGFPDAYKSEATTDAAALDRFRAAPERLEWTYLSPAPGIAPGERTGHYRSSDDTMIGDAISAEDYAVAVVDELEDPTHRRARFAVAA